MANGAIAYHWESQVEHAYMILEAHRFTGMDISAYLPFIRESLIFLDEHHQKRRVMRGEEPLDENGKLVIFPSTSCESYRGAKNPSDLVSGLAACIESILKQKIGTDAYREYFAGYLKRLPVQAIKIDRSFVTHMLADQHDLVIVRSTINMARNLGLQVVAEGAEDRTTYDTLRCMGCDFVQGYYVSEPLDGDLIDERFRDAEFKMLKRSSGAA